MQLERVFRGHLWVLLVLIVALLLDGVLAQTLAQWIMQPHFMAVPQLPLIALLMCVLFLPEERYIVVFAAVFGLVFDSFYTGILGLNTLIWPLVVYIMIQLRPVIPLSPLFVGAVIIIALTIYGLADYTLNALLGYGTDFVTLLAGHLGPSFVVNLLLFAIAYLPLSRLLIRLKER